jgi:hypothetical protein
MEQAANPSTAAPDGRMDLRGDCLKRTLRIISWLLVSLVLVSTAFELVLYMANLSTRHQAESLLTAVGHLRLGESTLTDTRRVRLDYKARKNPDAYIGSIAQQSYTIGVSNDIVNIIGFKYPVLWRFGVKPSAATVNLRYRGEKLTYLDYAFGTPVLKAPSQPTYLIAAATIEEQDDRYGPRPNYYVGYSMRPSSIAGTTSEFRFGAVITPKATDGERNAAFDFDLSCLSSLGGCQALCEIMPSVWREALRRYKNKEISLPEQELENPRCSQMR